MDVEFFRDTGIQTALYFKPFLRSILDPLEHSPCRTPQSSFNMSGRFYASRKHLNVLRREPPARGVAVVYSVLNRVRLGYGNYSHFGKCACLGEMPGSSDPDDLGDHAVIILEECWRGRGDAVKLATHAAHC